ncbi:hypothetical protein MMC10_004657 [Thelotrema lepadinum]|nr:hypothetical protein [Thelotrema lepadinum]
MCFGNKKAETLDDLIAARDASYRAKNPSKHLTAEEEAAREEEMKKQWEHMKKTGRGVLPISRYDADIVSGVGFAGGNTMGAGNIA